MSDPPGTTPAGPSEQRGRPIVERLGLAGIALVMTILFGAVAAFSFAAGELFLAAMGALGALTTAWLGIRTVIRG